MNEPAIRTEEQVISLFPDREGWWIMQRSIPMAYGNLPLILVKYNAGALGAKNNDSLSEKWVIVKFYTLKNQKCRNPNY